MLTILPVIQRHCNGSGIKTFKGDESQFQHSSMSWISMISKHMVRSYHAAIFQYLNFGNVLKSFSFSGNKLDEKCQMTFC